VSTNSIRGGANRAVLDNICKTMPIFEAWSDEDWFDNGAAVRVSLVCFGHIVGADLSAQSAAIAATGRINSPLHLNGQPVALIHADLTAGNGEENRDITQAKILLENAKTSFIGTQKSGAFDVTGELARQWLKQPNPNGHPNSQVVKPWTNGMDITRRPSDTWIIDFGVDMSEQDAALYEKPFEHISHHVHSLLIKKQSDWQTNGKNTKHLDKQITNWHLLWCARAEMRTALDSLQRFIGTARVAKYRLFVWLDISVLPDCQVVAITRSDDTTFGILHSRFHELWSLGLGTSLEDRPRYTPTTCFETFPFPTGLTPADTANNQESKLMSFDSTIPAPVTHPDTLAHAKAIAEAAFKLNQLRENWLNPTEWVQWVITPEEEKVGFPKRPTAKAGFEALLKKRTLTNLYNDRPSWLNSAHQTLDKAVANAYGWTDYTQEITDAEILQRLLKLNLTRS
jgi:hypothetical protein